MLLLIPFAAPLSDAGRQALQSLQLPHLDALLSHWREAGRDAGDEASLSPPHERALARALGWSVSDGLIPWAAQDAAAAGLPADAAWGRLTPVHLLMGSDHIGLTDPQLLGLTEAESRELFDAAAELFTSEGFTLHWHGPLNWLVAHPLLEELPTAAPDRLIGHALHRDLPEQPRLLRRLLNEVQMLFFTHPLNATREMAGELPVNGLWLSGCGAAQPVTGTAPRVDERLRTPALNEDWDAWREAWAALDAEVIAPLAGGGEGDLVLCGERTALTLEAQPKRWWQRFAGPRAGRAAALLETL
ncbi:hypothetical protein [Azohydromonas caseinilytica]|uniref:Phosphoglycerate mutase n=1 Tax=Azohydromonas caseinilytica TaxID=2728836 RepID=A0A848FAH7_9BURK|nr:hypothetical protein [Azohydromonas caseinilytica]NML14981.1 hypothetical protein [Azohydromonas caseinilytica]